MLNELLQDLQPGQRGASSLLGAACALILVGGVELDVVRPDPAAVVERAFAWLTAHLQRA